MRRQMDVSRGINVNARSIRPRLVGALSALVVLWGASAAPAQTFIERNLTPNTRSHSAGEPQIAVNPTNPKNIVYASTFYKNVEGWAPGVDENGNPTYEGNVIAEFGAAVSFAGGSFDFLNCLVAVSDDGGDTWTPGLWPNGNKPFCGDAMAHVDSNGIFYIAMDWMGHPTSECLVPTGGSSSDPVAVAASTDGGHNWSEPVATGTLTDRPWMRVDAATGKLYEESGFFGRTLAVSADRGVTWSAPVDFTNGSHLAVYDGILATWGGGSFHFSTDDGQSWTSRPVPGATGSGGWVSADPTKKGRFAGMTRSGNDYRVWVTSDTGQTWTASPPIPSPGATLPWMDFGWSGVLGVMWRSNADNNIYSVISTNQGVTFSNPLRVNSVSSGWGCYGDDLSWIASDSVNTYIGWAEARVDAQCDAFFARVPLGCYNGTAPASSCPSF